GSVYTRTTMKELNWTSSLSVVTTSPLLADNITAIAQVPASAEAVVALSILFFGIGFVGIAGNLLVICVILSDRSMRGSPTNVFIMNLSLADLLILVFGVPEIIQFILNRGWILGPTVCKVNRYILVVALYTSVLTLVGVCVERYIAIVHPIKAHLYCSRRRILSAIACFWQASLVFGLPTIIYNTVTRPSAHFPVKLCLMIVPCNHRLYHDIVFKSAEFLLFFLCPILVQVVLYSIIGKRLFVARATLYQHYNNVDQLSRDSASPHHRTEPQHMRARKGVVKMLIASVLIYTLSFAPSQIPLFYDIVSRVPFKVNWAYLVLVMTLGYVNSAANPILYSVFSQNYRLRFDRLLCRC
ncbi:Tachykinin-like peptides receptor 86C, partial [Lamellibrachia satsuma]